jgi:hypothetical protein
MVDLTHASWFSLSSVSLNTAATSGAIWFNYVLLATPTPNHESVKNLKRTRTGRTGLWGPPLGKFNPVWALTSNCPHRSTQNHAKQLKQFVFLLSNGDKNQNGKAPLHLWLRPGYT